MKHLQKMSNRELITYRLQLERDSIDMLYYEPQGEMAQDALDWEHQELERHIFEDVLPEMQRRGIERKP
jgi:hypothetical protein